MTDLNVPPAARRKRQGPRARHVPVRTCVVCREQSTKRQLVRIVRQPVGDVVIDATGRLNGRGAYLCDRSACWVRASETETLAKALNTQIPDDLRTVLRERAQAMIRVEAESSDEKERSTTDVE